VSAIRTTGLHKTYGGHAALTDVDLDVPEGSIYGLVGPNGSGKTTLLEILAGLRRASAGTVWTAFEREKVAYCPDVAEFEPWLSAKEVLQVALGLMGANRANDELDALLAHVGLAGAAQRRVGGLSRGMTTRLNLACGLVGAPRVVLADEPTAALDPTGRKEVLALIASLAPRVTVVISSHDLAELEEVCDHIGMLRDGRLVVQGSLRTLQMRAGRARWRVVVRSAAAPLVAALRHAPWVSEATEVAPGEIEVIGASEEAVESELVSLLASTGARVVSFAPRRPSLEELLFSLTTEPGTTSPGDGE